MPIGSPSERHNLPLRLSSLVGRGREIAQLTPLVLRHRLTTLVGAPGCGKTRLAEELGRRLAERFVGGVWIVDLASVSRDCNIEEILAGILAIPDESTTTTCNLVRDYLRDKQSLIILDNCEYLMDCAVTFASDVLRHCPAIHIIATSREPIRLDGELVWSVLPLQVPPPSARPRDLFRFEAAQLWLDRVRRLRPAFDPPFGMRASIAELCRRLDGIALGLELAAGWSVIFSPHEVLERLDTAAQLLTDRAKPEHDRHSSLHSAISWSHSQLSECTSETFKALGLFQGECHLDAIAHVAGLANEVTAEIVAELVDKSLVTVSGGGSGCGTTYSMLTTVREFANRELRQSLAYPAVRDRYIEHYLTVAERAGGVVGFADGGLQVRRLETEYANVDRALALASSSHPDRAARLAAALCPYWEYRHRPDGAVRWLTEVVARRCGDVATLGTCLSWLSVMMTWKQPDHASTALELNGEGVDLAVQLGDLSLAATLMQHRALILTHTRRLTEAAMVAQRAADLADRAGCPQQLALCVFRLGSIALTRGDAPEAHRYLIRSLMMAIELRWVQLKTLALNGLSRANFVMHRYEDCQASIEECLQDHEALTPRQFTILLETMAALELARSRRGRAGVMLDIARKLRRDYSLQLSESWRPHQDRAEDRPAHRTKAVAWTSGGTLNKEALAASLLHLLSTRPPPKPSASRPARGRLSRREREVADLVRGGLTNRQIAERLFITERTAEGHVERLRKKLNVHSRTAIAAQIELDEAPK